MPFIKIRQNQMLRSLVAFASRALLTIVCLIATGCTKFLIGEDAMDINPIEDPVMNITGFSQSLECMDELLLHYNVPMMVLTAQDIPNMASDGNLAGTKDMLITSLSKMGERSGKIRFVSYGTDLKDILLVHRTHEMKDTFQAPDFFIRGSITQHDKAVVANRIGGALRHDDWNAALAAGHALSYVSLDLNMGLVSNLQMLPGINSNNILAVTDRGFGNEVGGSIESAGLYFDFGVDRRDGIGQALRNLVDLGAIEVVGKLSGVPYLSCLPMDFKAPPVIANIRKEYHAYQDRGHLVRAIQGKLKQYNYYDGEVDGSMNRNTRLAIDYYRRLYGVPYSNHPHEISFELYQDVVYGSKYQWEHDRMAGRPDVRSFDQDTLIANELVKRKKEDVTKSAYEGKGGDRYYGSRDKKTPPVSYYGNRRQAVRETTPRMTKVNRPANQQNRYQQSQYQSQYQSQNNAGKPLDTPYRRPAVVKPIPTTVAGSSSRSSAPAPISIVTNPSYNRYPATIGKRSLDSSGQPAAHTNQAKSRSATPTRVNNQRQSTQVEAKPQRAPQPTRSEPRMRSADYHYQQQSAPQRTAQQRAVPTGRGHATDAQMQQNSQPYVQQKPYRRAQHNGPVQKRAVRPIFQSRKEGQATAPSPRLVPSPRLEDGSAVRKQAYTQRQEPAVAETNSERYYNGGYNRSYRATMLEGTLQD